MATTLEVLALYFQMYVPCMSLILQLPTDSHFFSLFCQPVGLNKQPIANCDDLYFYVSCSCFVFYTLRFQYRQPLSYANTEQSFRATSNTVLLGIVFSILCHDNRYVMI